MCKSTPDYVGISWVSVCIVDLFVILKSSTVHALILDGEIDYIQRVSIVGLTHDTGFGIVLLNISLKQKWIESSVVAVPGGEGLCYCSSKLTVIVTVDPAVKVFCSLYILLS